MNVYAGTSLVVEPPGSPNEGLTRGTFMDLPRSARSDTGTPMRLPPAFDAADLLTGSADVRDVRASADSGPFRATGHQQPRHGALETEAIGTSLGPVVTGTKLSTRGSVSALGG